ncbi:MAG: DUF4149 domain-containing protein [Pseudomonadota bacterium]
MKKFAANLSALAVTIWVGGLLAIGYIAVPVLFKTIPDKQLAGMVAGDLFSLMGNVGMVCAVYLLAYRFSQSGRLFFKQNVFWIILAMLVFILIVQCGLQPAMAELKARAFPVDVIHSDLAGRFKMLHGASSIIYLIQSLLGIVLVLRTRNAETIPSA